MSDYDKSIHHNPDAKAWAKFFMESIRGKVIDEDLMLGWFANAMMAMHDHIHNNRAQPEQEPVYWQWRRKNQPWSLEYIFNSEVKVTTEDSERRALYTTPPQRTWVGLTDEEIENVWDSGVRAFPLLARELEAKLKEKNT